MQWNYCNKLFCKSSILTWFYFAEYSWLLSHGIKCNTHAAHNCTPPTMLSCSNCMISDKDVMHLRTYHKSPAPTVYRHIWEWRFTFASCGSCVRKSDVFSPHQTHSLSTTSGTPECISVDQWTAATITGPTQSGEEWCHTHSYQHGRNGKM